MRKLVQTPRKDQETWVDYIQRATHAAEKHCEHHGYTSWDIRQSQLRSKFATIVTTGPQEKWSARILNWVPWFRTVAWRCPGRPFRRWSDIVEL